MLHASCPSWFVPLLRPVTGRLSGGHSAPLYTASSDRGKTGRMNNSRNLKRCFFVIYYEKMAYEQDGHLLIQYGMLKIILLFV